MPDRRWVPVDELLAELGATGATQELDPRERVLHRQAKDPRPQDPGGIHFETKDAVNHRRSRARRRD